MSRKEGNPKPQYADIAPENKIAAYSKAHYEKNKEQRRAAGRVQASSYRKKYPERVRQAKRNQWLSTNFKKTPEWYETTLKSQGGHCALCSTMPSEDRRFQVDHDHLCCPTDKTHRKTCGECIRGLLCENCNTDLGRLENFLEQTQIPIVPLPGTWLARALDYIDSYNVQFNFGYNALSAVA